MYSSIKTYIQTYIKKDKQKDMHRKKDRKIAKEEGKEPVLGMPLVFQSRFRFSSMILPRMDLGLYDGCQKRKEMEV